MNRNFIKGLMAILILTILMTACGQSNQASKTNTTTDKKQYTIVTSFYPMTIMTKNIIMDVPNVKVINMTEPQTGCLHDYQLSPADMKTLDGADAFIINGAGMENFVDTIEEKMPEIKVIEASKGISLIKNVMDGEENPHVWVSISGAIEETKNIAEGLSLANPENAMAYKKNSEAYVKKLEAQRDKMQKELNEIKNKDIVTFHEAFPYFAKEFGFNVVAIIEREPGSLPSAGELADTINLIMHSKATAIFVEPQYDAKAAESIAKQTKTKVYELDPVITGPKEADPNAYIKAMDQNLKILIEALKL